MENKQSVITDAVLEKQGAMLRALKDTAANLRETNSSFKQIYQTQKNVKR